MNRQVADVVQPKQVVVYNPLEQVESPPAQNEVAGESFGGAKHATGKTSPKGVLMSLAIDVAKVRAVLLPNAGWLDIKVGSFEIDAYEFRTDQTVVQSGGQGGVSSVGFRFRDNSNNLVWGPLTTILAVRTLSNTG